MRTPLLTIRSKTEEQIPHILKAARFRYLSSHLERAHTHPTRAPGSTYLRNAESETRQCWKCSKDKNDGTDLPRVWGRRRPGLPLEAGVPGSFRGSCCAGGPPWHPVVVITDHMARRIWSSVKQLMRWPGTFWRIVLF